MRQRLLKLIATVSTVATCLPLMGWAAWPDKPIRMVVPYAAGGGADSTARIIAQQMSLSLGQPILIDNRPGAGGVIGADNVAKAPADGYTVLYDASAFSQAAVADVKVREKLIGLGLVRVGNSLEAFARFVQDEISRTGALVKSRNIRVD